MGRRRISTIVAALAVGVTAVSCASNASPSPTPDDLPVAINTVPDRSISSADATRDASLHAALDVRADGCGPRVVFGSASLIADDIAITAAHVVAGSESVRVIDIDLIEHDATVIDIDPDLDLALLRVPAGLGEPLGFLDSGVEVDEFAAVSVAREFSETNDVITLDATIVRRANVATTDIYLEADVTRPGFEITAAIEPGDSGAAVVVAGQAAGVVWSRSLDNDGRAWAVNIPERYRDPTRRGALLDPVDTGRCP